MIKFWLILVFIKCISADFSILNSHKPLLDSYKEFELHVIDNFHAKSISIVSMMDKKSLKIQEIFINEIIKITSELCAVEIADEAQNNHLDTTVLVIDNLEGFQLINSSKFGNFGVNLIILLNGNIDELHEIFRIMWNKKIYQIYALINDSNNAVNVMTFEPFENPQKCGDTTPKLINKFTNKRFIKKLTLNQKFLNMNKCPIDISTFNENIASFKEIHLNGTVEFRGHEIRMIKAVAEALNFTAKINFRDGNNQFGLIFDNGTATNTFGDLIEGRTDIAMGDIYLKYNRWKNFATSIPYLNYPIVFVIPPGRKLTVVEKFLQPFHLIVWISLILIFVTGVVVIFIINIKFKILKSIVYGHNVHHPITNMFAVLLGLPQTILPQRSFARFILMNFIIMSLVMRNIYQGSLFKFLQSDGRQKEVQNINEMIERNFTIIMHETNFDMAKHHPKFFAHVKPFIEDSNHFNPDDIMTASANKAAILGSKLIFMDYIRRRNTFPYKICKEHFLTINVVMYYNKKFHLKNAIDFKVRILIESGLIGFWMKEFDNTDKWKKVSIGPSVLTVDQLIGAFYLLFGGLLVGMIVFVGELLICKWKRNDSWKKYLTSV